MEAGRASRPAAGGEYSGWIAFAGVMLFILGSLNAFWGLAGILNDEIVVVGGHGSLIFDITTWGWVHLILGSLVALAGLGLMTGNCGGARRRDLPGRPQCDRPDRLVPGRSALGLPDDRPRHGDPLPADDELVGRRDSSLIPLADFTLGAALLTVLEVFLFVAWIWVLVTVIGDLFGDHEVSGWGKAAWTFALILVPFFGVFLYLIVRGGRHARTAAEPGRRGAEPVRRLRPADRRQLYRRVSWRRWRALHSKGVLSDAEFAQAKQKLLAGGSS